MDLSKFDYELHKIAQRITQLEENWLQKKKPCIEGPVAQTLKNQLENLRKDYVKLQMGIQLVNNKVREYE